MSNSNYAQIFKSSSDHELVKIVTVEVHKYKKEAVAAAETELAKRNLSNQQMAALVKEVATENTAVKEIQSYVSNSGIRFVNFSIDFLVFLALVLGGSLILDWVLVTSNSDLIMAVGYGMIFLIFVGYFFFCEFFFQKTAGKYLTKTIVVTDQGLKPDASTILIRTLCRLIPFDRLSFLIAKNGFHDRFSKTQVIKEKD